MADNPLNLENVRQQLQDVKAPDGSVDKSADESPRKLVDAALTAAESGDSDAVLSDVFFDAVKKIRMQSNAEYLKIKKRYDAINGLRVSDFNAATKIYKSDKKKSNADSNQPDLGSQTKADMLIELVKSRGVFFHDADDECYCSFSVPHVDKSTGEQTGEHWETHRLEAKSFAKWANHLYYEAYKTTVGDNAFKEAKDTLSGLAIFEGDEKEVCLRVGMHEQSIFVDIGDDLWRVVKIDRDGWQVIDNQGLSINFVRPNNMRPLPMPKKGGSIDLLWDHLNLQDKEVQKLVVAWLLECLRVDTPYTVIEITGEQGTAKSTFQERLCELIDPNKVNLVSEPRNIEDVFVATKNHHLISYNNLSHLSDKKQDALCVLSTGGGTASRKLYTSTDEEIIEAKRPIVINGISQLATRPDLGDRVIAVEPVKIKAYKTESDLKAKWQKDYPLILGALYGLMAATLKALPSAKVEGSPRMADFTLLGQAMFDVMGVDDAFADVFSRNRERVINRMIEGSPVALAIIEMIEKEGDYRGTKGNLFERLLNYIPKGFDRSSYPKTGRGLTNALKRIAPALRVRNIDYEEDKKRKKDGYHIHVFKLKPNKKQVVSVEI